MSRKYTVHYSFIDSIYYSRTSGIIIKSKSCVYFVDDNTDIVFSEDGYVVFTGLKDEF